MMPWCLTENNTIHTTDGWVDIKKLNDKSMVYNKHFEEKSIKKIGERRLLDGESIISIKVLSCPEYIEVTNKHNLYTVEGNKPIKKEASDIKIGDYLFVPKPTLFSGNFCINMLDYSVDDKWLKKNGRVVYSRDFDKSDGVYNTVNLSDELFYLVGLYLAEGCVYSSNSCVSFSFNSDEAVLVDRCKKYFTSVFGISEDHFYERYYEDRNGYELIVNNTLIGRFFKTHFGAGAGSKNIPYAFMLHDCSTYRKHLLKGYWDGDGHISYRHSTINPECVSTTKSFNLCMCLREILLSFDIVPSTTKNIRSDGRVSYITSVSNEIFDGILGIEGTSRVESLHYKYEVDGGFAVRVSEISSSNDYSGIIYSISVDPGMNEDNNGSYILGGISSSNSPWYRGSQLWAEPNLEHAALLMREIYNNQEDAKKKGEILRDHILTNFCWKEIGKKIVKELEMV